MASCTQTRQRNYGGAFENVVMCAGGVVEFMNGPESSLRLRHTRNAQSLFFVGLAGLVRFCIVIWSDWTS
jgi:hypothetical protein